VLLWKECLAKVRRWHFSGLVGGIGRGKPERESIPSLAKGALV
jgi:hypothetical protein